jgi:predicted AAA+ superfamily ATPase
MRQYAIIFIGDGNKTGYFLKKLIESKHNGLIKIITGMRRCCKSYCFCEFMSVYIGSRELALEDIYEFLMDGASLKSQLYNLNEEYERVDCLLRLRL